MANTMRITYRDDKVVEVRSTPRGQVQTERFLREQGGVVDATLVEATYRLAFESLRSRRMLPVVNDGSEPGYEEWLDMLEEVEEVDPDEQAKGDTQADPTPAAIRAVPSQTD